MASEVVDREQAAALDALTTAVDRLFEVGVDPFDARDALVVIRELEVHERRLRSVQVEVLDRIDHRGLHRHDGHASAKVMVRHAAHLSNVEASRRARGARCLRDLPVVRAEFRAGRLGFCQLDWIARAHANVRVRERLCANDEGLARLAVRESYEVFDRRLSDWVRAADEDGTCDRSQRSHENRDSTMVQNYDLSCEGRWHCGSLQGLELFDIFQHYFEAETRDDWAKARLTHGDAATVEHLERTDGQRRFDAMFAIFQRAAGAEAGRGGGSQITTDIVIDHTTFERHLRRLTGAHPDPVELDLDPEPGSARDTYRCSSLDGRPVDPTEAVANALVGHVRRVVVGSDSVVIDLGRRSRLFRGAAALAVRLANTECYWPGCNVPVTNCQIDHLLPGPTTAATETATPTETAVAVPTPATPQAANTPSLRCASPLGRIFNASGVGANALLSSSGVLALSGNRNGCRLSVPRRCAEWQGLAHPTNRRPTREAWRPLGAATPDRRSCVRYCGGILRGDSPRGLRRLRLCCVALSPSVQSPCQLDPKGAPSSSGAATPSDPS